MSNVKRIYVEKKASYAVKGVEIKDEIINYLGIKHLEKVRILNRYDIENLSEEVYLRALGTVFYEPPVDSIYEEEFPYDKGDKIFSVEFLPGQFDQRADSAVQCVKLLNEKEDPVIHSAITYVLSGKLTVDEFEKIKSYCINPVDSMETDEVKPETLITDFDEPDDVRFNIFSFCAYFIKQIRTVERCLESLGIDHIQVLQNVFLYFWRGRSRESDYGNISQLFDDGTEVSVFRAEIVSPFRNTVCFVNRHKRKRHTF